MVFFKKKRILLIIALCLSLIMTLTGCGQPKSSDSGKNQAGDGKKVKIGLVLGNMSNPFWGALKDAAEKETKKMGNIELTILGSNTLEEQVKVVEDLIQTKVDLVGIAAWDAKGIIPAVEKANQAGIKVITVDCNSDGGNVEAYIATDNVEGGRLAGEWLVKAIGGKGKIAIIEGSAGSSTNVDRVKGFRDVISKYQDIKVIASSPADWVRDKGLKVASDIITGNPDLTAIMAMNDEMALGALEALKAAGKADKVKLIGYNGAAEALQQVFEGNMAADVVQYPEEMGRLFVKWAVKVLNGEKPPEFHIKPPVNVVDSQAMKKNVAAATGQALQAASQITVKQDRPVRFGLVLGNMSNPFWGSLKDAAEQAAKTAGNINLTVLGSNTLEEQVKVVEDLIQTKVDLIGIAAWDAKGIIPAVEKANAANIPVITVDCNSDGGKVEAYIATDNVEGGRLAGEWLAKAMEGSGKLAIIEGSAGSSTNVDRVKGFKSVIEKYANIKIVASSPADWVRDKGLKVMSDIITGQPDLKAVMAMNDEMALGALEAIKAAGKAGQVIVVGYNGASEALQQVAQGSLAADVVQYPEEMGTLFVEWGIRILKGEKSPQQHIKPAVQVIDTLGMKKQVEAVSNSLLKK